MSDASLRETAIELSTEVASLLRCDSLEAAPALLGAVITVADSAGRVAIRLTEVEAYRGEKDPGSHAFRGRTARNGSMFEAGGCIYVYFTYGMHHCVNIVCGPQGIASTSSPDLPGSHARCCCAGERSSKDSSRPGDAAPQPALTATWPVARPDCAPHWDWTAPTTARCWAGRDHASA